MQYRFLSKFIIAVLICFGVFQESQAQDIHFSQFYASPLTLNPAMTGLMQGCYRGAVNYRNQYPELPGYAYSTVAASFDMPLMRGMIGNDFAGAGLQIFNDRQGDGALNNLSILGSAAYHKSLDRSGNFLISIGVQGGWVNKSVDFTSLFFESQLDGNEFNPNISNGEAIEDNNINYFDLRAGAILSARVNKNVGVYGGGAYFHITEPNESFLGDEENTLGARLVGHAGAEINATDRLSINPNVIYMTQSAARELVIGANVGYQFDGGRNGSGTAMYIGASYRLSEVPGDAVIALVGAEFNSLKFGISYDINISTLKVASLGQGGIELSMGYEFDCAPQGKRGYPPVSCPRF